jgi:quinol monooxygenase YgiN
MKSTFDTANDGGEPVTHQCLRLFQSAVDPDEVGELRRLFLDDVRPAFDTSPGCLGIELAVCDHSNAGGLVDIDAISRWTSAEEMEVGIASRPIQEAVVRFRSLLRQEPVAKVLKVVA